MVRVHLAARRESRFETQWPSQVDMVRQMEYFSGQDRKLIKEKNC